MVGCSTPGAALPGATGVPWTGPATCIACTTDLGVPCPSGGGGGDVTGARSGAGEQTRACAAGFGGDVAADREVGVDVDVPAEVHGVLGVVPAVAPAAGAVAVGTTVPAGRGVATWQGPAPAGPTVPGAPLPGRAAGAAPDVPVGTVPGPESPAPAGTTVQPPASGGVPGGGAAADAGGAAAGATPGDEPVTVGSCPAFVPEDEGVGAAAAPHAGCGCGSVAAAGRSADAAGRTVPPVVRDVAVDRPGVREPVLAWVACVAMGALLVTTGCVTGGGAGLTAGAGAPDGVDDGVGVAGVVDGVWLFGTAGPTAGAGTASVSAGPPSSESAVLSASVSAVLAAPVPPGLVAADCVSAGTGAETFPAGCAWW